MSQQFTKELSSIKSVSDNLLEENKSLKEAVKSIGEENDADVSAPSKNKQNEIKIKSLTDEVRDLKGQINSLKADNHNLTRKLKSQNKRSPALPVKCSEVELNTKFI